MHNAQCIIICKGNNFFLILQQKIRFPIEGNRIFKRTRSVLVPYYYYIGLQPSDFSNFFVTSPTSSVFLEVSSFSILPLGLRSHCFRST